MQTNLTSKQYKFIDELIKGKSQREAYRTAYPKSLKWKDEVVDVKASQLFKNDKVLVRYNEIIEANKSSAIMTSEERKIWLTELIANEKETSLVKLKALDILNKMNGEYITKTEVSIPDTTITLNIK